MGKNNNHLSVLFTYLLFVVLCIVALYPLIWIAINSFKTDIQLFEHSWSLPKEWHWENYVRAWKFGIAKYILNSIIVTISAVLINVSISLMAAFALSRFQFKGKNFFLYFILGGLMLAPEVSLIPLFRILTSLKIYNTYLAMILPNVAFGIPFTTFLVRSYMLGLPRDYEEAAYIDGANTIKMFWYVVIPLCRPIIASAMLLDAMRVWNEFMFALTFVINDNLKTLPLGLMSFAGALREQWTVVMAGIVISSIPMIALYLLTQKQFIRGLAAGGIKG
ncbi:MAG: carbohydrate ABC transporter permease [Thermanaerothrix sp.]|uniref:carbohydrate ABC transporter permease n=1 Tax=Thermanaerothrix sp. TaxID=2972675 RepID=UPI003C7EA713